jgi:hypothetical protein
MRVGREGGREGRCGREGGREGRCGREALGSGREAHAWPRWPGVASTVLSPAQHAWVNRRQGILCVRELQGGLGEGAVCRNTKKIAEDMGKKQASTTHGSGATATVMKEE